MSPAEPPANNTQASDDDPRQLAKRAASFGAAAADYAEHRPGYPDAAIEWVLEPVRGRRTIRALDLGAGTGRLTEALHRAEVDVIAVEPDPQMRAQMLRLVFGVAVLAGSGENIPLPDARVDVVVVGQALHWFDQRRALPEIARVLNPGGVFAALWNVDDTTVEWAVEFARLCGFPADEDADQRPPIEEHEAFGQVEWRNFDNPLRRTIDSLVAMAGTYSAQLVLEPAERAERLRRLREFLRSRPETASGEFDVPKVTAVARAVRL